MLRSDEEDRTAQLSCQPIMSRCRRETKIVRMGDAARERKKVGFAERLPSLIWRDKKVFAPSRRAPANPCGGASGSHGLRPGESCRAAG